MTGPCAMAGPQCPNAPACVVRIAGVGDRALCQSCITTLDQLGVHYTIQAGSGSGHRTVPQTAYAPLPAAPLARRIAALAPAPAWRPAWLRRDNARDLTGGLR